MNYVEFMGNLIQDPRTEYLKGHRPVTYMPLLVDYTARSRSNTQKKGLGVSVISYDENILGTFKKGDRCLVKGQVVRVTWEDDPDYPSIAFEAYMVIWLDRNYTSKRRTENE